MNIRHTFSRETFLAVSPEVVKTADIVPPDAGIGQLKKDIERSFATFNGVLPPSDMEVNEASVTKFLREQGFSEKNIPLLIKYFSQKPFTSVLISTKLVTLKYNEKNYPEFAKKFAAENPRDYRKRGLFEYSAPENFINEIFEKNGKVYYKTKAWGNKITDTLDNPFARVDDEIESLFELTDEGFKFVEFKTSGQFNDL